MPEKKIVVLIETEDQVRYFLKHGGEIKGTKVIIALTPFAIYELEKHDAAYRIPEDYYQKEELYRLGMDNFDKLEKLCGIIDGRIHECFPVFKEYGITPGLFSMYHLKLAYDPVTTRLFQMNKIMEAEKPDIFYIFGKPESTDRQGIIFDNDESIYAQLLALPGWNIEIRNEYIGKEQSLSRKLNKYKSIKKIMRYLHGNVALYNFVRSMLIPHRGRLKFHNSEVPVLLLGNGYDWDYCQKEMESVGIGPIIRMPDNEDIWVLESKHDRKEFVPLFEELKKEVRSFFIWGNIDFFPLFENRLAYLIELVAPASLKAYEETASLIRKKKIKALLAAIFITSTDHSAARAAHNAGIPVVTWQHGEYGLHKQPFFFYSNIMSSDAIFVYGPGVALLFSKIAGKSGTGLLPVGSAALDTLREKADQRRKFRPGDKKTILYVTSNMWQNHNYISWFSPPSDNHIWRVQKSIVDVLNKKEEYKKIIKLHPSMEYKETPLSNYVEDNEMKDIEFIRNERSVPDVIEEADAIIIDLPTTTLLQCLSTEKQLFVYSGHINLEDNALELLKRRAHCESDLGIFIDDMNQYLGKKEDISVTLEDRSCFRSFGISEGNVRINAAKTLMNIIDQKNGRNIRLMDQKKDKYKKDSYNIGGK